MRYAAAIWTRRWSMLIAASLVVSLNVTQPSAAAKVQPAPDSALAGRPSPDQSDSSAKSQPISLTVNAVTGSSISIGWSGRGGNPRSGGVAGYRLFRDGLLVDSTSGNTYTFTDLSCDTSYALGVAAVNQRGSQGSMSVVVARTGACTDTTAPTMPGNLHVVSSSTSTLTIGWDASTDPNGVTYGIYQGGRQIDTTTQTTYTLSNLPCGTNQALAVDAYDSAGNHSLPALLTAGTAACTDTTPPTMPRNLHVLPSTSTSTLTIGWDASTDTNGVAGYGIYQAGHQVDTTTQTTYTFSNLPCGTIQALAVDAYDKAGNRSPQALLTAGTAACADTAPLPIAGQGYSKVFADEFNSLDRSVWDDHIWYDDPPSSAWAPTQYVDNGIFHLVSRRNDLYPGCTTNCYPIITATTLSSGKSFQYGYFEARMRWTKGAGSWPAFWLLSTGWAKTGSCATPAGELDVMEGQGTEPNVLYGTIHKDSASRCGGDAQNGNNWQPVGIDLTAGFHTYAALWTATTVSWYLDDKLVMAAPTYSTDNQPMFLLLQMWSGGWTSGPTSATPLELQTEVDWVHVWQK